MAPAPPAPGAHGPAAPNSGAPVDVAGVIARMEQVVAGCAKGDGVGAFTSLYLAVTRGVQAELGKLTFADPAFLARLDVVFAGLFFDAFEAVSGGARVGAGAGTGAAAARCPRAWAPLFEARGRTGVAPLQFALAGMNAHINRDLPVAVVRTCLELGVSPSDGCPQHADYLRVNGLLASVEARIKGQYLTGALAALDRVLHRVHRIDDVVAMWNVARARDAAWVNALALWELRDDPALSAAFVDTLDRTVGFAGRGLLIPAETRVARLGRRVAGRLGRLL